MKETTTMQLTPKRVRVRDNPRVEGDVFDVDTAGWIFWVGDDKSCHVSKADWLEVVR